MLPPYAGCIRACIQRCAHMTLLSDRVHQELKRRLSLWEYLPGQRLGEEAVASEFGVSRTPVRDAFRRLEREGFLEQEGWAGCRVRKPDLLGRVLFDHDPLTYLSFLMAPAIWWLLFRSRWGLLVRGAGERGEVLAA